VLKGTNKQIICDLVHTPGVSSGSYSSGALSRYLHIQSEWPK
jgi:hypothetical protein